MRDVSKAPHPLVCKTAFIKLKVLRAIAAGVVLLEEKRVILWSLETVSLIDLPLGRMIRGVSSNTLPCQQYPLSANFAIVVEAAAAATSQTFMKVMEPFGRYIRLRHRLTLVWARCHSPDHPAQVPLIEVTRKWRLYVKRTAHVSCKQE